MKVVEKKYICCHPIESALHWPFANHFFFLPSFWLFERSHVWITSLGPLMCLTLCLISNLEMTHTVLCLTTCECMWILMIDDREASTFEIQSQFVGFVVKILWKCYGRIISLYERCYVHNIFTIFSQQITSD